jgi:hypothetical protein
MSKNQECMEKILTRLTGLIEINESDTKELRKLVDMACCVSAQLAYIDAINDEEKEIQISYE